MSSRSPRASVEGPTVAGRLPLATYYFLFFATVGITQPFLPAYFRSLGLSGTTIGALLALYPMFSLVAPQVWGHLADRTGRADRVLSWVAFGALLGFAPLLRVQSVALIALACSAWAAFNTSVTTLADSLTIQRAEATGDSYARIRVFGSIGFVASSTAFGLAVASVDRRVVVAALSCSAAACVCSLFIRARSQSAEPPHPLAGLKLLKERDIALFLACTALHWFSCAPFHGSFAIHVGALGLPPSVVGLGAGLGVSAEVLVMIASPALLKRFPAHQVLAASFAASALRWFLMSLTSSAAWLIGLQVIHGLTFGGFYMGAVAYLSERVPPRLRASGQALFAAATFGIGGLLGFSAAGAAYDLFGGHRLFGLAAVLELVPAALVLRVSPKNKRAPESV